MARRFASIDVGTNTVLLLVAERRDDGTFFAVDERMELTRLGRGVDRTHLLDAAAIEETVAAVRDFAAAARDAGADDLVITATSAARDARNGGAFFDAVRDACGVVPEVLSGEEEARLSYESARRDFGQADALAVMDVGGGSTELIFGVGGELLFARSLDVGAVRLTERWLHSDPPSAGELAALRADLAQPFAKLGADLAPHFAKREVDHPSQPAPPSPPPGASLVGVAGTVTTLCALHLGLDAYDGSLVHGQRLALPAIRTLANRLANLDLAARKALPCLPPKRADVIVAGAELVAELMEALGFEELIVSDRGVRWGLLYDRFGARAS